MNTRESHRIICLTKLGQFTVLYLNAQIMFNDCDFVGEKKIKGKRKKMFLEIKQSVSLGKFNFLSKSYRRETR